VSIEIGIALAVLTAITGAFWRMWDLIEKAGKKGEVAQSNLDAHRLHTAETYVTKAGMQEQTALLMKSIEHVADRVDGINTRLDRILESRPAARRGTT
jgi:hypothetical protein